MWRFLHPDSLAFTWMRADGSQSSKIDVTACPQAWSHSVQSCKIIPCPYSDHSAVVMLAPPPPPQPFPGAPGKWKLNTTILKDSAFVDAVTSFWVYWRTRKASFRSLSQWWDRGKERVKGLLSASVVKSNWSAVSPLLTTLAVHLKFKIDSGIVSLLDVYERVLGKISELHRLAAESARVSSQIRWAEEGKASSRYFLRLEKKTGTNNWIPAMHCSDGSITSDVYSICTSWVDCYSSLFSAGPIDPAAQDVLLSHLSARLPGDARVHCEGPLSSELALISLVFKKGDHLEHKNWRPISLLNVDYKALC